MTTVKELIEKLKEYPDDTVVSVDGYEDGVVDEFNVSVLDVILNSDGFRYKGEHEPCSLWRAAREADSEKRLIISKGEKANNQQGCIMIKKAAKVAHR